MALMREPALRALFDWDSIAHGVTFSRRHNVGLKQVLGGLYRRLAPSGQRLVAIDSTVATVFGCQQGAALG